ncbi:MAG: acyl-CoA thioesterase [Deltaproteobacteria bacterium]|nr:acyl-CoA thioesterase [Deltaproteobacteria bacterium]
MESKPVSRSSAEFTHLVLPSDTNALGTIFGGRIMEWTDIAAAVVASRHCRKVAVTASMDALHFISPIRLGDIVVLKAAVNFTATTSMEIGVRIECENPLTGERRHTASAYLTFVALDDVGRPTAVPAVTPETPEEKRRFQEGQKRREDRIQWKSRLKAKHSG